MQQKIQGLQTRFSIEGEGKPLLLLHGWKQDSDVFSPILPHLTAHAKVIRLDLPGFGESELPKTSWGSKEYALFVDEFLTQQNIPDCIVVGHSFGGKIALFLAKQSPDRISKLILIDSAGIPTNKGLKYYLSYTLAKILKPLFSIPPFSFFFQEIRHKFYHLIGETNYIQAGKMTETFKKLIKEDVSSFLRKISQPTLLIWGENDRDTPISDAYKMHKLFPTSTLYIVKGARHFSFLEKPVEVSEQIVSFIEN